VNNFIVYTVAACSGGSCSTTTVQAAPVPPVPVVIYQAAPRPILPQLFAPRPQVVVIQGSCAGGKCR
jgi:hypothetical protein